MENDSPCEGTAETSDIVRSTKRPLTSEVTKSATKRQRQIAKEDELLKKAITCMENASNANKASSRDADAVFGEYVASELRSIKNEHTKRVLKFRIQSMLFSSLSEWSATSIPHEPWPDSLLASAPPPSCTSVLPVPSVVTTAYPSHATEFGSSDAQ